MKKLLVVIALCAAAYLAQGHLRPSAPAAGEGPEVVLYATEWCGYCRRARQFLQTNNIPYIEHDIEKSEEAYRRYRELGGRGVPLLTVRGRVIRGYNPDAIVAALR